MTSPKQLMVQYLAERGISRSYAETAGFRAVDAEMAARMAFPYAQSSQGGIVIPYFNPVDRKLHDTLMRIRYFGELPLDKDGKPVRYAQPKGSSVEAFFDANVDWLEGIRNSNIRIAITEGEAKAMYMNQNWRTLNTLTIGLGGVWNFRDHVTRDLTPWLRMMRAHRCISGGEYIIAFDSDMAENVDIQRAAAKLSELLGIEEQKSRLLEVIR